MPPNELCNAYDAAASNSNACKPIHKPPEPETCTEQQLTKELHIAPMLNYSTREFRQLLRILSKRAVVWTEMVVDDTIRHCKPFNLEEFLGYDIEQHPIVCQIGGNSPAACGDATGVVLDTYGYDEVNLNIDCPSERVSGKREFGAVLMTKARLAVEIVKEMQLRSKSEEADAADVNSPSSRVSIKCRIGVDDLDDLEFAAGFIRTLRPVCRRFYLHARKCVLKGLMNARQNRSVPPLNYPRVYELCRLFPDCDFWINGGIRTLEHARLVAYGSGSDPAGPCHGVPCRVCDLPNGSCIAPPLLAPDNLRGCMMGRAAMDDPCLFHDVDRYYYGEEANPCQNRRDVLEKYCAYLEQRHPRRCVPSAEGEDYCSICAHVYSTKESSSRVENEAPALEWATPTSRAVCDEREGRETTTASPKNNEPNKNIASPVIGRCLKPVQGLFNGIPGSRVFRRICDTLGQDATIRNCGPGYILRTAMQSVPPHILDQEF